MRRVRAVCIVGRPVILCVAFVCCGDSGGDQSADAGNDTGSAGTLGGVCRSDAPRCEPGLACDYRDGTCAPNCLSETRECFSPFVCQENDATAEYACDLNSVPTCRGTPPNQRVPFATTDTHIPIHWPLESGCLPVSYDETVADVLDRIRDAHQAWNTVSCSRLCFEEARQHDQDPDIYRGELRVHWTTGATPTSSVTFSPQTGAIVNAQVMLPEDSEARARLAEWAYLHAVGHISGLAPSMDNTADSVMVRSASQSRTELGGDDETALCVLYGTPAYCED
jgi:hypothetical protein